jgi:hypothetical protein
VVLFCSNRASRALRGSGQSGPARRANRIISIDILDYLLDAPTERPSRFLAAKVSVGGQAMARWEEQRCPSGYTCAPPVVSIGKRLMLQATVLNPHAPDAAPAPP